MPEVQPFLRVYQGPDRDALKPGDSLDYVYEREAPEAGVVGTPMKHNYIAMVALIFGGFVAPFLVFGVILKRRERARVIS